MGIDPWRAGGAEIRYREVGHSEAEKLANRSFPQKEQQTRCAGISKHMGATAELLTPVEAYKYRIKHAEQGSAAQILRAFTGSVFLAVSHENIQKFVQKYERAILGGRFDILEISRKKIFPSKFT